ncbi:sulfotransferase [Thermococcus camini]|uniref:Sulfotransferase n=1 Tax=Thermococcus camini TaxID=2016373 RepID=A0A7G2D591_9EURY|nr:sulfotransferase [Thermococcus camini]CAD5243168.1 Sulfotransferase [Thermococcus camini]
MGPLSFLASRINYALDLITARLHDFRIEDTIVISGTPRSGSTWLMELLESLPEYKSVFEPFHPSWYPEFRKLGIPYDPYVPTSEDYPKLRAYLEKVFTGRVGAQFPHRQYLRLGTITRRFKASKLIVKFVRANTMLPWIANTFNLRATYFIIRHPCATIASQIATGYYSRITPEQLANEVRKVEGLEELAGRVADLNTEIGRLAAVWAFENYVSLASKEKAWYTVVYERLVSEPEEELPALFAHVGEEVPGAAWERVGRPSMVTRRSYGKEYIGTPKQLLKWREKLSERQVKEILEVASWFGLDFYTTEPEPDYDALARWGVAVG